MATRTIAVGRSLAAGRAPVVGRVPAGWRVPAGVDLLVELKAYWRLEEASGTRFDAVGTNHLIDINTVASVAGKVGTCADFTAASNENLACSANGALMVPNGDWTVSFWGRLKDLASDYCFIALADAAFSGDFSVIYFTGYNRFMCLSDNVGEFTLTDFGVPEPGKWYHFVMYRSGSVMGVRVNGELYTTTFFGGAGGNVNFRIGHHGDLGFMLNGFVDEVGKWDRKLNEDEQGYLYNHGNGRALSQFSGGA